MLKPGLFSDSERPDKILSQPTDTPISFPTPYVSAAGRHSHQYLPDAGEQDASPGHQRDGGADAGTARLRSQSG